MEDNFTCDGELHSISRPPARKANRNTDTYTDEANSEQHIAWPTVASQPNTLLELYSVNQLIHGSKKQNKNKNRTFKRKKNTEQFWIIIHGMMLNM